MHQEKIRAIFDQIAPNYDDQWKKTAPIREGLFYFLDSIFSDLPGTANILCVGAGTGEEMAFLAKRFPEWRFTAVEPSGPMLLVCRQKAEVEGFISRCRFHEGYLETLPKEGIFDGATSFLVSQFILDPQARTEFFREIAARLRPGGILVSSDLSGDSGSSQYDSMLNIWMKKMAAAKVSPEWIERMRETYTTDVAILTPAQVESIIRSGGFEEPIRFFQAGLIHAWFSSRGSQPVSDFGNSVSRNRAT